jgi:hypothetical protein
MRHLNLLAAPSAGLSALALLTATLGTGPQAQAQGCIAVRGGLCALGSPDSAHILETGDWQVALSYRWLHSFRHFAGDVEQTQRLAIGNEVINDSHFFDLSLSYTINSRFNATFVLPFVHSDRSSFYEHSGGNPSTGATRYHTQAGGLADLRLGLYGWVWDPAKMPKGNIQIGLGMKAPSGDYKASDTYFTTSGPRNFAVDQSIQPGDGGWGVSTELYAWRSVFTRTTVYLQGLYLFNPMDDNGVSTQTGLIRPKSITALRNGANAGNATAQTRLAQATALGFDRINALEDVMSISDQYMGRGGASVVLLPSWGLSLSFGARIEGVPVEDALGDSNGFRRPGYTVSIEPGISMMKGRFSAGIFAPIAMYRNREASVADQRWGQITGLGTVPGDAAFADYVITVSAGYRF